jgi:hypothetical protein
VSLREVYIVARYYFVARRIGGCGPTYIVKTNRSVAT